MKKITLLILSIIVLSGCDDKPKSIDYYSKHTDEAKAILDTCNAKGDDSVNCYHAKRGYVAGTANEHKSDGKMQLDSSSY